MMGALPEIGRGESVDDIILCAIRPLTESANQWQIDFSMRSSRKKFLCALCPSPEILMTFFLVKTPFLKDPFVRHQRFYDLFKVKTPFLTEGSRCPSSEILMIFFLVKTPF